MRLFMCIAVITIAVDFAIACGNAWADHGVDLKCPFGGPYTLHDFAAMQQRSHDDSCIDSGPWEARAEVVQVLVPCLSAFQSCAIVRFDDNTFVGGCFPDRTTSPVTFQLQQSNSIPKFDFTKPMRPVTSQVFALSLGLSCQSIYTEVLAQIGDPPSTDQLFCKSAAISLRDSYRVGRICCCKTTNCTTEVLKNTDEVDILLDNTYIDNALLVADNALPPVTPASHDEKVVSRAEKIAQAKARTPWKLFEDDVPAMTALYFIGIAYGLICAHWTFILFTTIWDFIEERRRRTF